MADAPFPPIDRALAARLDCLAPPALMPPALPGDFAARLAAAAQTTPQVPPLAPLPKARDRWRAIGLRARLGIAAGSLALVGLGSVSAAAAGFLGEPVNRAVHRIPVVGKLIEKVIPEKRRHHHAEAEPSAGLGHTTDEAGLINKAPGRPKVDPRPAAAFAPPLVVPAQPLPIIAVPGLRPGGQRTPPPWRYPGPLPRTFPPGPERRAAIAAFRAFRAEHPVPPEVIAARRQRQAAIMAERQENPQGQGLAAPQRRQAVSMPPPDPFATAVPPEAIPPRPNALVAPPRAGALPGASRPAADAPAFQRPVLDPPVTDPSAREQLRLERQRARIEARRLGLDPLGPGFKRPRGGPWPGMRPGLRPPGPHPGPHLRPPGGSGGLGGGGRHRRF